MAVKRTSVSNIVLVYLASGLLGWGVARINERPFTQWFTIVAFVLVAAYLLWKGREVKKMVAGSQTSMTPLGAAQVLAWAKAAALFGAILGGAGFGVAAAFVPRLSSPLGHDAVVSGLVTGATSIGLVVVALLVERWCEIPPDDDENGSYLAAGA